ncbi:hypothetical protein O1611_g6910 [Lasiodiplodia mahajangana]|uniref:Uncharacterized protein n=1 Tax=Lasiodiplodia mahajangana TaxID=1108764 RepID=A0ACC2JGT8_9PEZI|nr:hypothetical protein O1611_g6910 [Lasiodiplodia mahajangana]
MPLGRKKHYFLPPVPEVPVDGPIRLGSIVPGPKSVFEPVNNYPVNPSSCSEKVYVSNSGPASIALGKSKTKNIGIFAELPAFVNANINGDYGTDAKERWSFENLRTIWFVPSAEYVRQSLADTDVQLYIQTNQSWLGHTNLYMVTGVKVAFGASALSEFATSYGFDSTVGLDLSTLGVPITVGPIAGLWNGLSLAETSSPVEPVVFAFRLRRIKISANGDINQSDYNKKALLGLKDPETKATVEIDTDGVEDRDATGADFNFPEEEFLDEVDEDGSEQSSFSKLA